VAPDDAPRRLTIEMVLLGGRTDTLTEFVGRAADAGLEVTATGRDSSGRFVVECRPTWSGSPMISD
jgi:2,7-dihydroxy-5-methyl-1-naphthoate 7-O-methyltransferase